MSEDKTDLETFRIWKEDHRWARGVQEHLRDERNEGVVSQAKLFRMMREAYENSPPETPVTAEALRIADWLASADRSTDQSVNTLVEMVRLAIRNPIR